ncbi:MAG: Mu transposase C-terminal domain-containing protein [Ignavibacteriaceae bacterium]|nr:Mu transposase C-terminal domain-containing protein [Ignavibacteriaceae bacterium]
MIALESNRNSVLHEAAQLEVRREDWCSVREAADILGISNRAVRLKIRRDDSIVWREVFGNGGKQYLILKSSLNSEGARSDVIYSQPDTSFVNKMEVIYSPGRNSVESISDAIEISEENSRIAYARYDLIMLYLQYAKGYNGVIVERKKGFVQLYNKEQFPDLYVKLGETSYGTCERWLKTLKENGFNVMSLAPGYKPKQLTVSSEQAKVLFRFVLVPEAPPINEAIRIAKIAMKMEGIKDDKSDSTYRRFILKWKERNNDLWEAARGGEKALNDNVLPFIKRDKDAVEVGDIVVADGHVLNFEVLNPFTGKPKRMSMIAYADFKSNKFLGFDLMPTENTLVIASALRRTIRMMSAGEDLFISPKIAYLDNGRAFRAKYFKGVNNFKTSGLTGLFQRLGIKTIYAWPYHGQSKIIERLFGILAELERQMISYTGTSIEKKPARMMRGENFHRSLHERITGGTVMTIQQAYGWILNWMEEYHKRPHQDGFYKGYSPNQIWEESFDKIKERDDYKSRLITGNELNYLMLTDLKQRQLRANGIEFNGEWYWNEALYGRKHGAYIKYDLFDDSHLLVYDEQQNFICKAVKREYAHPAAFILGNDEDIRLVEAQLQEKGRLKRSTMRNVKELLSNDYVAEKQLQLGYTMPLSAEPLLSDIKVANLENKSGEKILNGTGFNYNLLSESTTKSKKKIAIYESELNK